MAQVLAEKKLPASFFFTGRFYRDKKFRKLVQRLKKQGHYLGAHSDQHLLYCDWNKRDSLLVTHAQFVKDLEQNYAAMKQVGIPRSAASFYLPPYEWYNDTIAAWTKKQGLTLINFTPGTRSNADYTWPELKNYQGSEAIYQSVLEVEQTKPGGLNGFILLLHIGTDPRRTDKFYERLPRLIAELTAKGYQFQTVEQLLTN